LDKAEFSEKPQNLSAATGDDIPAALRDSPDTLPSQEGSPRSQPRIIFWGLGGLAVTALLAGIWYFAVVLQKNLNLASANNNAKNAQVTNNVNTQANNENQVLGHFAYSEAPESELAAISADGRIKLRSSAAAKYKEMVAAAQRDGVSLVAISGFRSVKEQQQLFFGVKAQRNQTPAERAALSAPPGYSEHHTGYAVDIGDGAVPATNLTTNFEKTRAFQWLEANAARYGFEISFPRDNTQGVSYEPWHWRFVGDQASLETFYKARNVKPAKIEP
jgi:D-alanyl-D-alanine carboxypeptidase